MVQDLATQWIQSCPCKRSLHVRRKEVCHNSWNRHTSQKSFIYTGNSLEFGKSCEDQEWNHRTSTAHGSETNGIVERAVRRVLEGTSAVLLQSGWSDSVECHCHLRSVQDLLADGKTPYERRFGEPLKGPIIPFGGMVEYRPISPRELSIIHQFGKKVLPGIFLGCELIAGGIWKGDILIAVLEDLEKLHASEIYPRRIHAKEVWITQKMMNSFSQWLTVQQNCQEETTNSEDLSRNIQGESECLNWQNQQMTLKPVSTSGRSKVTSSIVTTMNLEFNSTCRRKKHSLFHCNTLM